MYGYGILFGFIWMLCTAEGSREPIKANSPPLHIAPRFPTYLYPGDAVELQASVINSSGTERTGQLSLQLFDAANNHSVDGWFNNIFPTQYFTVAAYDSAANRFPITVPVQYGAALKWQVLLHADSLLQKTSGEIAVIHLPKPSDSIGHAQLLRAGYRIRKQFFLVRKGKASVQPINEFTPLKTGDEVQVQLTITTLKTLQLVTLIDHVPAALRRITTPVQNGRQVPHSPTATGLCLMFPSLPAGRHQIRYHTRAAYMGNFAGGHLQLKAKNIKLLLAVSETKLQVTE